MCVCVCERERESACVMNVCHKCVYMHVCIHVCCVMLCLCVCVTCVYNVVPCLDVWRVFMDHMHTCGVNYYSLFPLPCNTA